MFFTRSWPNRIGFRPTFLINRNTIKINPKCTVCTETLPNGNFRPGGIVLKTNITTNRLPSLFVISQAKFSKESTEEVDAITYENVCEETLDSLCEFFEDIVEKFPSLRSADVVFGDGVLTVNLEKFGTYVINRQSPNKQIWLSSPTSGPKRYDFVPSRNTWVYRHNNQSLHFLLQEELSAIVNSPVDLNKCAYSGGLK